VAGAAYAAPSAAPYAYVSSAGISILLATRRTQACTSGSDKFGATIGSLNVVANRMREK
jgi:hypothetical protein